MTLVRFVRSVLSNFKHLKALNLVARDDGFPKENMKILSIISAHTQLEDLQITLEPYEDKTMKNTKIMKLETNLVNKLIKSCQNLRILKFGKISILLSVIFSSIIQLNDF